MGTTYTLTIDVNVWKEHQCVGCGTNYRYLFKRKKTGQGATPDAATKAAHAAVVTALTDDVDMHPCPGCGLYQPDMVGARRRRWHWIIFLIGLPILVLLLILTLTDLVVFSTASWVAAGTVAVLGLLHLCIDANNPNSNPDANKTLARRRLEAGQLWVPDENPPEGERRSLGSGLSAAHMVCYLLLAASLLAFLAPVGLMITGGMKSNPDWHPEVVGPGDEAYVWFPQKVSSIKGMWNGTPLVSVVNANEAKLPWPPPQFPARAKTDSWAGPISAKSSETDNSSRLWAYVRLPDNKELVGQTLKLRIDMGVRYPSFVPPKQAIDKQETFSHEATLVVSGSGAGEKYRFTWWLGSTIGAGLLLLSGALLAILAGNFRKQALPTRIFVPEKPGAEDEHADEDEQPQQ